MKDPQTFLLAANQSLVNAKHRARQILEPKIKAVNIARAAAGVSGTLSSDDVMSELITQNINRQASDTTSPQENPMSDPHKALEQAQADFEMAAQALDAKRKALSAAELKVKIVKDKFKRSMPVSDTVPCQAAVLPDGQIVVVVQSQLTHGETRVFMVTPGYHNADSTPRHKYPHEQLGK